MFIKLIDKCIINFKRNIWKGYFGIKVLFYIINERIVFSIEWNSVLINNLFGVKNNVYIYFVFIEFLFFIKCFFII